MKVTSRKRKTEHALLKWITAIPYRRFFENFSHLGKYAYVNGSTHTHTRTHAHTQNTSHTHTHTTHTQLEMRVKTTTKNCKADLPKKRK